MGKRFVLGLLGLGIVGIAAWLSQAGQPSKEAAPLWTEISPGLYRVTAADFKEDPCPTPAQVLAKNNQEFLPAGYALVDGPHAILFTRFSTSC